MIIYVNYITTINPSPTSDIHQPVAGLGDTIGPGDPILSGTDKKEATNGSPKKSEQWDIDITYIYIMIYWDNQFFGEFYGIQVLARYKKTTFTNLREHPSRTSDALCAAVLQVGKSAVPLEPQQCNLVNHVHCHHERGS